LRGSPRAAEFSARVAIWSTRAAFLMGDLDPQTLPDMRSRCFWALVLTAACSNSPDETGVSAIGGGGTAGGLAGSNSAGSQDQASAGAGGSSRGGASSAGAGSGGLVNGGGNGGGGRSNGLAGAGGTTGGAGRASGGAGGAGGASAGTANGGGGAGGASACVPNLACKVSPPPTTGDIYQDCVDRINQFLTQCACLPALARRKDGEACADQMAEYDASMNSAHAGAIAKICTPGGAQNECPGYSSNSQVIGLCMQQMWDEGPPPSPDCTGDCYEKHGHFINMTDPDVKKVACGFYTTSSGKVWATQNFTR
jgi:hypothetical protein